MKSSLLRNEAKSLRGKTILIQDNPSLPTQTWGARGPPKVKIKRRRNLDVFMAAGGESVAELRCLTDELRLIDESGVVDFDSCCVERW